jgi:hypothetical protein
MVAVSKRPAPMFGPRPPAWLGFALMAEGRSVARLSFGCPQARIRHGRGWRVSPILTDYNAARLWAEERVAKRIRKQLTLSQGV